MNKYAIEEYEAIYKNMEESNKLVDKDHVEKIIKNAVCIEKNLSSYSLDVILNIICCVILETLRTLTEKQALDILDEMYFKLRGEFLAIPDELYNNEPYYKGGLPLGEEPVSMFEKGTGKNE